jgi:hypothetical protein
VAGYPNWLDSYVKQVCFGHGVPVIYLGAYRTYALQVRKATKHAQGEDLAVVIRALVERYAEKGLRRKVLVSIAFDVFNIAVAE